MSVCLCVSLSPPQIPLQKLLFSATLTQNPEKLQLLDLHQPRLFSSTHSGTETSTQSQEAFNFPQGLAVSLTFPECLWSKLVTDLLGTSLTYETVLCRSIMSPAP